jgi:chorismate-pyruvate lyase
MCAGTGEPSGRWLRRARIVERRLLEVSQSDVIAVVHARALYGTPDRPHERRRIVTFGVFDGYYRLVSK